MPEGEPTHAEMLAAVKRCVEWRRQDGSLGPRDVRELDAAIAHLERTQPTDTQADLTERARATHAQLNGLFPMSPEDRVDWIMQQMLDGMSIGDGNRGQVKDYLSDHFNYLQSEREAAAAEARRAAIEECALLLKGRVYKTRYREYPALGGDENWSGDSAFVRHCDKFAEAILALASPPAPQEDKR